MAGCTGLEEIVIPDSVFLEKIVSGNKKDAVHYWTNELSGRIYMFSVFEDDDNITGAYFKMVSNGTPDPSAKDTLFFFKMDFEGNFLLRKGYTLDEIGLNVGVGGQVEYIYHLENIVKTDSGYIMYSRGTKSETHGVVDYFDNEFNYIAQRYIQQTGIDFEHTQSKIYAISVTRSNHNTTYLSTEYKCEEENMIPHIRLYEIDDNLNDTTTFLPIVRYIRKASDDIDRPASRAVCTVNDSELYFVYTLNIGYYYLNDSWIVIEKLNSDFDTITTYFYDEENGFDFASRILTAKDGGVLKRVGHTEASVDICHFAGIFLIPGHIAIEHDVAVFADHFPCFTDELFIFTHTEIAVCRAIGNRQFDIFEAHFKVQLDIIARGIDRDLIADCTAKKLIHRHFYDFAEKIPQGDINAG